VGTSQDRDGPSYGHQDEHGPTHDAAREGGALRRILDRAGSRELLDLLGDEMPGADVTTFLLEVMRRRASDVSAGDLMRRYGSDRFVVPSAVPFDRLRRTQDRLLAALPAGFEVLELAPLIPLGAHSAIAPVDQNNVVSTVRGSEVAADPTNGLALEAALRRRRILRNAPRSSASVRLAAIQRAVRGQRYEGAMSFAHFQIFALVTAGRDEGGLTFERESASEHVLFVCQGVVNAGADRVRMELTDFGEGRLAPVVDAVTEALSTRSDVEVLDRPDREEARGYYRGFCFKAFASFGDATIEVADGGHVDWTQQLVPSRKERLMITGLGVDRLAAVRP
jgi:hypothetical protein